MRFLTDLYILFTKTVYFFVDKTWILFQNQIKQDFTVISLYLIELKFPCFKMVYSDTRPQYCENQ